MPSTTWQRRKDRSTVPQRKAPSSSEDLLRARRQWSSRIAPESQFHRLLELIPGVHFFAKDERGRTMYSSQGILQLYGMRDEAEIVGLTDYDLNPAAMADAYVADDRGVYESGEAILEKVELWFDEDALPQWFLVSKLPIRSVSGEIMGIMGLLRPFEGARDLPSAHRAISPAVEHIRRNYRARVELADVARILAISPRQVQRRFRETLGMSPQELLVRTRVLAACRALRETSDTIVAIASECGFYDQSSFTEHFRRYMGTTPLRFRRMQHVATEK